jgi:hypothetical protein
MEPNYVQSADGPADYGFVITPSDTVDLPIATRSVFATTGGVVKWHNRGGAEQHTTFASGERIPIRAQRILSTGTTATGLEGLA